MHLRLIAFLSCASLLVAFASQIKNLISLPVVASPSASTQQETQGFAGGGSGNSRAQAQPSTNQVYGVSMSRLSAYARSISVKVLSEDSWGSGILIQRQGSVYTVLTNEHVLQAGKKYRIQTHDGRIYSASEYKVISFKGKDLALLQFRSPNSVYSVAFLGREVTIVTGDEVFAAGFPFETDGSQTKGFKFTEGQVSLLTDKALDGGYQVGYTNAVEKGMSGGPVLNTQGEVVAINGIHSYPLWGDPYVFEDGSKPCQPMHDLIVKSSWAIPIKTFINLIPKSWAITNSYSRQSLDSFSISQISSSSNNSEKIPSEILQAKAEAAKSCR